MNNLTRKQAAKALNVSLSTLIRNEGIQVFPTVTKLGENVFPEKQIARLVQSGGLKIVRRRRLNDAERIEITHALDALAEKYHRTVSGICFIHEKVKRRAKLRALPYAGNEE